MDEKEEERKKAGISRLDIPGRKFPQIFAKDLKVQSP
jgi:hypothetical protein